MGWIRVFVSPAGIALTVEASHAGIRRVSFGELASLSDSTAGDAFIDTAAMQLQEYFAGSRQMFDLALDIGGTGFQRRVWEEVGRIPFGETRTYLQIACAIGAPGAVRAVGAANGANPVPILIPCHRVVASGGGLGGYGGGLDLKKWLLDHESYGNGRLFSAGI
jgi:methylated-DNA-[protein]-cysteine S-methyltransferase